MIRTGAALVLSAVGLLACASSADQPATAAAIAVTGRVTTIGSEPRITLVIVSDNEEYELIGDQVKDLWHLQQRYVTVTGRVVREAYGPGFPTQLEVNNFRVYSSPRGS